MSIIISIQNQTLTHHQDDDVVDVYPVSTGLAGVGEQKNSGRTPRGKHIIRAMIGRNMPKETIFSSRRPIGNLFSEALFKTNPEQDWILSRILWLSGCEVGKNRLGEVDTMQRYIYIHGSPPAYPMGVPLSHGCIRMRPDDVVSLFDKVHVGESVMIEET